MSATSTIAPPVAAAAALAPVAEGGALGVCLAGGGGKGGGQLGALQATEEFFAARRRRIAGVSGTSIGAFNALLYAQGDLAAARAWWARGVSRLSLLHFSLRGLSPARLFRHVERLAAPARLRRPGAPRLWVTYVEGSRGRVITRTGHDADIVQAVQRSMRIPGVFDPELAPDGRWYVDGGVRRNANLDPFLAAGTFDTIVVLLNDPDRRRPGTPPCPPARLVLTGLMDALDQRGDQTELDQIERVRLINRYALGAPRPGGGAFRHIDVIPIRPDRPLRNSTTRFNGRDAARDFETMYAVARRELARHYAERTAE